MKTKSIAAIDVPVNHDAYLVAQIVTLLERNMKPKQIAKQLGCTRALIAACKNKYVTITI